MGIILYLVRIAHVQTFLNINFNLKFDLSGSRTKKANSYNPQSLPARRKKDCSQSLPTSWRLPMLNTYLTIDPAGIYDFIDPVASI